MKGLLSDVTTVVLAKSLDCIGLRHRVIADNIANVETPGFTRSDVSFRGELGLALRSAEEVRQVQPSVHADYSSPARPDGNNVSIDREMAEMAKNSLEYETLVQLLSLKGAMIRAAITEGRR